MQHCHAAQNEHLRGWPGVKGEAGEGGAAVGPVPGAVGPALRRLWPSSPPRRPPATAAAVALHFAQVPLRVRAPANWRAALPAWPRRRGVRPPGGQADGFGWTGAADHDGSAGPEAVGPVYREPRLEPRRVRDIGGRARSPPCRSVEGTDSNIALVGQPRHGVERTDVTDTG
jgi:hypothetical protein